MPPQTCQVTVYAENKVKILKCGNTATKMKLSIEPNGYNCLIDIRQKNVFAKYWAIAVKLTFDLLYVKCHLFLQFMIIFCCWCIICKVLTEIPFLDTTQWSWLMFLLCFTQFCGVLFKLHVLNWKCRFSFIDGSIYILIGLERFCFCVMLNIWSVLQK